MAEVVERRPADQVVVEREHEHYHDTAPRSNTGVIIAVILIILALLIIFGRGIFSGGSGGSTDVNITPSTSTSQ
jgi:hypothetical protein